MAVAISRPAGGRVDDVRSLRFRFRRLTFTGTYTSGGETVTAAQVGLKRVQAVVPLSGVLRAANGVTGELPVIDIGTNGANFVIRALEDAAGTIGLAFGQEKSNAEAYAGTTSILDVLVLGY